MRGEQCAESNLYIGATPCISRGQNMMTRKHFEKLARILCEHSASTELIYSVMNMCQEENPHFNTERFIKACGIGISEE